MGESDSHTPVCVCVCVCVCVWAVSVAKLQLNFSAVLQSSSFLLFLLFSANTPSPRCRRGSGDSLLARCLVFVTDLSSSSK